MSEVKKDNAQDAVKQLAAYKGGQFAELKTALAAVRARLNTLTALARSRREALAVREAELKAAEEREAEAAELAAKAAKLAETLTEPEPAPEQAEETEPEKEEVSVPAAAEEEPEAPAATAEEEKAEEPAAPEQAAEAEPQPEAREEKKEPEPAPAPAPAAEKKPAEARPVIKQTDNPSIREEVLPDGRVRRVYVPPTTPKKGVTTRVFEGGYTASRSPRPQGAPRPQGGYTRVGGGMAGQMPPAPPAKGGKGGKGGRTVQGRPGAQRDGDRSAPSRIKLVKQGFIVNDKYGTATNEEYDERVRVYKGNRSRGQSGGQAAYVDHAVITSDPVPIKVLSEKTGIGASEIISNLFSLGIIKTINESIDFATAELIIGEITKDRPITLELKSEATLEETLSAKLVIDDEDVSKLRPRPPVVTIMGHVDHGKTSLLDYIRKSNVAGGEAGGITQHIGAYTVSLKGSPITFLDTPGHEAFTSMRARGAQVTDIAVLVVAADDGIMPQTIEAINHARQAEVPIIVAVNKIDKTGANPDQVLHQLTEQGVLPEEWGGETPVVRVSAKTGEGVEMLLENILTMAEIRELKANPDRPARGTIIEARLDKGVGKVATILVQTGTLCIGDYVVAGTSTGKIRAMVDDKGRKVKRAGPSVPVSVTGWDEVPEAGDIIDVVADEKFARELAAERKLRLAAQGDESGSVSLSDLFDKIKRCRSATSSTRSRRASSSPSSSSSRRMSRAPSRRSSSRFPSSATRKWTLISSTAPSARSRRAMSPSQTPRRRSSSASMSVPTPTPSSSPRKRTSTSGSTTSSTMPSRTSRRRSKVCSSPSSARSRSAPPRSERPSVSRAWAWSRAAMSPTARYCAGRRLASSATAPPCSRVRYPPSATAKRMSARSPRTTTAASRSPAIRTSSTATSSKPSAWSR